jgi:PAS domain S-box-containing protein
MFVGLLEKDKTDIPDISLSLLSIILFNSSNALESFELYNMIREINVNLEKKENYKSLFEAAPDGVEVLDARGNIVDCNKTYQNLLGYNSEEIVGNHTTEFFSENSKALHEKNFSILKENGYGEGEMEIVCKDGAVVPVWRKEKAIYDENMSFVGSVVYNRDMCIFKKAEEEKKDLESQLQRAQKMEALGTLAGGVAHDLNNILGGVVSYPELLLMQIPEDSPFRKQILTIQKSGEKAATIVQDLLTLARRGVATTEVVNLTDIIVDYFKTPEQEKLKAFHPNVEFDIHLEDNLLNIMGSPVHLSKTIMNLVSNAAEAMPDGGKVFISAENQNIDKPIRGYDNVDEGDYIVLTVSDTGIGIPPEHLDRIFEPFYTKKAMGRSGTGLGMAVVWGTVKDHKGYIDVQSTEGKGTAFRLYFPVTISKREKEKAKISSETYLGNGETILIIDDVEEQREIAYYILANLGYSVATVSSGEEAVEYMKNNSADLLVLDMIMDPGIDGLETYKRILELHPGQKAILVSGFSETDRVKEAQGLGAGAYVKKPYLFEKIGVAVKTEINKFMNERFLEEEL